MCTESATIRSHNRLATEPIVCARFRVRLSSFFTDTFPSPARNGRLLICRAVIVFAFALRPFLMKGHIEMTPRQIELVQNSFNLITPMLESATMLFYDCLFQLDPSLRRMFRNSREEQARKLGMCSPW